MDRHDACRCQPDNFSGGGHSLSCNRRRWIHLFTSEADGSSTEMPELVTELKPCSSTSATQIIHHVTRRYYSIFSGRRQLFARSNFSSSAYIL